MNPHAAMNRPPQEPDRARPARYGPPRVILETTPADAISPPLSPAALLRAPPRLFLAGDPRLLRAPARVSIVGSRNASSAGRRRAEKLARQLAHAGVLVVSGLARGIDHAAHTAAIAAGGPTIAVIGTPLDRCYPREHARLQELLCRDHLVVSQLPAGSRTTPASFPARNRLMAALSHASVIVEASDRSGTLSQATETQTLGQPLFLMRNVVENQNLRWPARFLALGAIVLDSTRQILDVLAGREP